MSSLLQTSTGSNAPRPGDEIVGVAEHATAQADADPTIGELVVVARTADGGHRTLGGGRIGPLRAAVSVAVAAGNHLLWDGTSGLAVVERSVRTLPEIVRTAAEASGLTTVHVGCIQDGTLAALAIWFPVDGRIASVTQQCETMQLLAAASERQRLDIDARAAEERTSRTVAPPDLVRSPRQFDPDDPTIDPATGLVTGSQFEAAIERYDADEATLVVVAVDDHDGLTERYDSATLDRVALEIADRMVIECRKGDLVARLDDGNFAVLLSDASRSTGLQVAKRLLVAIARPLAIDGGPDAVSATVALAHQFGLVDMDELVESAGQAVTSAKRAGPGRLVIAS